MARWEYAQLVIVLSPDSADDRRVYLHQYSAQGVARQTLLTAGGMVEGEVNNRLIQTFEQHLAELGTQGWEMVMLTQVPAVQKPTDRGVPPGGTIESWNLWFKRQAG